MNQDRHRLDNGQLTVAVLAHGAELCSLRRGGAELLWQAGPEWARHAPVLFPIVGRLAGDTLRHDGRGYRMTQHGFARDRGFRWLDRSASSCRLELSDDAESREIYPFAFRLEIGYELFGPTLLQTLILHNPARTPLPASLGLHPAFRWPLAGVKTDWRLVFDMDEPAPIRRLAGGALGPEPLPTPVAGRVLALDEALFAADAIIMTEPASRGLTFTGPVGAPALRLAWSGFPQLGIWSKPGADFLCVEPWHGYASPAGFDGDFAAKPGAMLLAPGACRRFTFSVTVGS